MCNCGNCGDSIISNPAGADGLNGEFGGYSSIFIYNGASTTAPPPSTSLRFNDLDPTLTTKIYVSNVNAENVAIADFLTSLDNSSKFGFIRVFKEFESETFYLFELTGVNNTGSYHELTVNYLGHSFFSTPTTGDRFVLSFAPAGPQGPKGNTGDAGTNGTNGLDGTDGFNGVYGGYSSAWKFDTTITSTPSIKYITFNNASPGSTTNIYVSITNRDSINMTNFLNSLTNSGDYGFVRFFSEFDSTRFAYYRIDNITTTGSVYNLNVTYVQASVASFNLDEEIVLSFSPSVAPIIADNYLLAVMQPAADITNSTATEISSTTELSFGVPSYEVDPLNAFNNLTGTWTCPATGYYDFNLLFAVQSLAPATGFVSAGITRLGIPVIVSQNTTTCSANLTAFAISATYTFRYCTIGETYGIKVLNRTGSTLTSPTISVHYSVKRVA